jgi:hypothetical protein
LALFYARKEVKAALQCAGIKPQTVRAAELSASARAWLERHPELIARAAETIQKVPALLKIAQREDRDRQRREMERRRCSYLNSGAQNARRLKGWLSDGAFLSPQSGLYAMLSLCGSA